MIQTLWLAPALSDSSRLHKAVLRMEEASQMKGFVTKPAIFKRRPALFQSYPFIGSSYAHYTTPVSPHQLISTLGYLQTQCTLSRSKNCSSEHVHNIMTQCEERMKPAAGYFEYDRHRLLRVKMDTSKRLMIYDETDKERECLIVRSTLSELYELHHKHCHHVGKLFGS